MKLERDWRTARGVLFLDPFETQVKFETIQLVGQFHALDPWILMPVSAIARLLPKNKEADEISKRWKCQSLNPTYGDKSWPYLYQDSPQLNLYQENSDRVRDHGIQDLISIYIKTQGRILQSFSRAFPETKEL